MSFETISREYLPAIETELQDVINRSSGTGFEEFHHMLAYHMGWEGEGAGRIAQGKRIRPLLVLLTTTAAGGNWEYAIPAAASVELIHNFSLIHDDIEDNSPLRRGRLTVWKKWGIPQATNAGDAMFTLAYLSVEGLNRFCSPEITLGAMHIVLETCLKLTKGQYLDMSYEKHAHLKVEDYWPMVEGKTAALTAACTGLGALIAGSEPTTQVFYGQFGRMLGLAFQVQDDLLGIWGDAALTGKSAESDLISGKKSLPVLYGLSNHGPFADRWNRGSIQPHEVADLAAQLEREGARQATQGQADRLTDQALEALENAKPRGNAGEALRELADILLHRKT